METSKKLTGKEDAEELEEVKIDATLNDVTSAVRNLQSLFSGLTARVTKNEDELQWLIRGPGGKMLRLNRRDVGADLVGTVDELPLSEEEEEEYNRRQRKAEAKLRESRRKQRNADEHGGYKLNVTEVIYVLAVLYGYAMMLCMVGAVWYCTTAYVFPLSDYTGLKYDVPAWDYQNMVINLTTWNGNIPISLAFFFYNSSFWESGVKAPGYEQSAYPFAPTVAALYYIGLASCAYVLPASLLHSASDIDLYYYYNLMGVLNMLPTFVVVLTFMDLTVLWFKFCMGRPPKKTKRASVSPARQGSQQMGSRKQRRRSSMMAMEDQIRDLRELGKEEGDSSSRTSQFILYSAMFGSLTLSMMYPVLFLPIFNSDAVDDFVRIFIVTVLHSFLVEVTLLVNRYAKIDTFADPELAVQLQWSLLCTEMSYQLTRRIMMQCMVNPQSSVVAIAIVSLEEAILRGTFVERDSWFRRMRNGVPISKMPRRKAEILRRSWAVQIFHSMLVEIVCIIMAKFFVIIYYPDRFVINLGFQKQVFNLQNIFVTLLVELAVEFTVDGMAINKEINKQDIPIHLYPTWMTKDIILSHVFATVYALGGGVWGFVTPAMIWFCSSYDPCTCSGGPHKNYEPLCAFLSANSTVQAHANISGFHQGNLHLPSRYIMESGNGTFALNLASFRDEYKNPIAYMDDRTRSTLGTGAIVCLGIVGMMLTANYLVKLLGYDVDTRIKRVVSLKASISQ